MTPDLGIGGDGLLRKRRVGRRRHRDAVLIHNPRSPPPDRCSPVRRVRRRLGSAGSARPMNSSSSEVVFCPRSRRTGRPWSGRPSTPPRRRRRAARAGVGGGRPRCVHGAGEDGRLQVQAPVHDVVRRARVGQLGVIHDRALDGHVVVDRIDVGAVIAGLRERNIEHVANLARLGAEVRGASAVGTRRTRRPAVALRRQTRVLVLVQAEHLVVRRPRPWPYSEGSFPSLCARRARGLGRETRRSAAPDLGAICWGAVCRERGKGKKEGDVACAVGRRSGDASRVSRRLATRRERLTRATSPERSK